VARWQCYFCGHVHDEAAGDLEGGVAPGTPFADIPEDWTCPVCGAEKDAFHRIEA
jgi:rubredoxin